MKDTKPTSIRGGFFIEQHTELLSVKSIRHEFNRVIRGLL